MVDSQDVEEKDSKRTEQVKGPRFCIWALSAYSNLHQLVTQEDQSRDDHSNFSLRSSRHTSLN